MCVAVGRDMLVGLVLVRPRQDAEFAMYYHHRELAYVRYGKVGPPPVDTLDPEFARAYKWLGQYCGFFPQVWLSRSKSWITGRGSRADGLLFGFESIQGFPVAFDFWCKLLPHLMNSDSVDLANTAFQKSLEWQASDPRYCMEPVSVTWRETRNIRDVLSKHLFVKHDQVVVPNLNLKAAKVIICRNENQKRALRRMGFIEDRVVINRPRSQPES
jgi:hypothetical protein